MVITDEEQGILELQETVAQLQSKLGALLQQDNAKVCSVNLIECFSMENRVCMYIYYLSLQIYRLNFECTGCKWGLPSTVLGILC